jgi:hypothetical protein
MSQTGDLNLAIPDVADELDLLAIFLRSDCIIGPKDTMAWFCHHGLPISH